MSDNSLPDKIRLDVEAAVKEVVKAAQLSISEKVGEKKAEYTRLYGLDSKQFLALERVLTIYFQMNGMTGELNHATLNDAIQHYLKENQTARDQPVTPAPRAATTMPPKSAPPLPQKPVSPPPRSDDGFNDSIFDGVGARSSLEFNPEAEPPPEPPPRPTSLPIPPDAEIPPGAITSSPTPASSSASAGPSINPDPEVFGETKEKEFDAFGPDIVPIAEEGAEADPDFAPIEAAGQPAGGQTPEQNAFYGNQPAPQSSEFAPLDRTQNPQGQPQQGMQPLQGAQQPQQGMQPLQGAQQPQQGMQPLQGAQQPQQGMQPLQGAQQPQQGMQPLQGAQQPQQGMQPLQGAQQPQQGTQQQQGQQAAKKNPFDRMRQQINQNPPEEDEETS